LFQSARLALALRAEELGDPKTGLSR
jgi:hypothetical protein